MTDVTTQHTLLDGSTGAGPAEVNFDALESLRDQLAERDNAEDRLVAVEVPKLAWRLLCATDFEYARYAEWQRAALGGKSTASRRRSRNPLDLMMRLDQAVLATHVLVNTCEGIEFKAGSDDWVALLDNDGEPMTLTSDVLLARFNVVDPRTFTRRLFGRDAALIHASEEVARAAGWIEDDLEEETDPTA